MSGAEHYHEAERCAERADALFDNYVDAHDADGDTPDVELIRRQTEHCREMGALHATLALASATALTGAASAESYSEQPDLEAWVKVAGVKSDG